MVATVALSYAETKTVPEVAQTQFATPPADIRNYRYCEIIPAFRTRLTFMAEIYSTIDLNECPADLWSDLDKDAMKQSYDAVDVKLNGPRYWVVNKIEGEGETATGKTAGFGGIEMGLRALIETKLWEGTEGSALYTDNQVQRSTTFNYNSGEMVYELTSAEGGVYRMQSYEQIIDATLTIDDLEMLGARLELPEGWSFEARVLTDDDLLIADGLAS